MGWARRFEAQARARAGTLAQPQPRSRNGTREAVGSLAGLVNLSGVCLSLCLAVTLTLLAAPRSGILPAVQPSAAESTQFQVLPGPFGNSFRDPEQCERMECIDMDNELCLEHLPGFYLRERGCQDLVVPGANNNQPGLRSERICTDCVYGQDLMSPTTCKCEKPLFTQPAA